MLCLWLLLCRTVSTAFTTHTPSATRTKKSPHAIRTERCYGLNEIALVLTRRRERANSSVRRVETTAPLYIKFISAGLRCRFTFTAYSLFTAFFPSLCKTQRSELNVKRKYNNISNGFDFVFALSLATPSCSLRLRECNFVFVFHLNFYTFTNGTEMD